MSQKLWKKKADQAILQLAPDTADEKTFQKSLSIMTLGWWEMVGVLWQQT